METRIQEHHGDLLAFLRRRRPQDAEELAQEVWIRMSNAAPTFETNGHFRAYMYAVARKVLIDAHRRSAARVRLVPLEGGRAAPDGAAHGPDANLHAAEMLEVVERTLASMKPALAEVFRLRTATGMAFKDIAARQGVSLGTALSRMHQATKHLRKALTEAGFLTPGETP